MTTYTGMPARQTLCEACKGQGRIGENWCRKCDGTGKKQSTTDSRIRSICDLSDLGVGDKVTWRGREGVIIDSQTYYYLVKMNDGGQVIKVRSASDLTKRALDVRPVRDRAALHRALDAVMDRAAGRDALDDKQFLDLMEKVGREYNTTKMLRWPGDDNPKIQAESTAKHAQMMKNVKAMIASSGVSPAEFIKRGNKVATKVGRRVNLNWINALGNY